MYICKFVTYIAATGILTSPGYPDAYTRGTRTTAIELPNPNATVLLQFQKLDLTATGYTSSTFFRVSHFNLIR